ncbi:hypothetical protein [Tunturiibacter psychrotolerans]|uniref:hypothetical protein n=1 Tax=Tunturiibacter psychrotolerans TaxID=3069686 RepID=UPI003D2457DF
MNSGPASPMSFCILVYGSDQLLLNTRTMVLEKAGYAVLTAIEASDVERIILSQKISLLVLCHTLSSEKCEAALELAESRRPVIRSLVLTAGMTPCSERAHDAILSAFDGPRRLVETVEKLFQTIPAAI